MAADAVAGVTAHGRNGGRSLGLPLRRVGVLMHETGTSNTSVPTYSGGSKSPPQNVAWAEIHGNNKAVAAAARRINCSDVSRWCFSFYRTCSPLLAVATRHAPSVPIEPTSALSSENLTGESVAIYCTGVIIPGRRISGPESTPSLSNFSTE